MFRVPLSVSHPVCDALEALQDEQVDYVDPVLKRAHETLLEQLEALCFELNGMTDISDEGPQVLEINHPGTAAERNELNRQACHARDTFLPAYKAMINLLNTRNLTAPTEPDSRTPQAAPPEITVTLAAGYTTTRSGIMTVPISLAGQVKSKDLTGPHFFAVQAANQTATSVQIASVGIETDCRMDAPLPYFFPPVGPGPRTQLPFPLGSHASGHALANAPELGHAFLEITKRGGTPTRVRPFARTGSGTVHYGPWTPAEELLPFLREALTDNTV
ncbi:hypothetical protein [Streptomyces sp. NPDC000410]|uniref:hypothetical protein n=1 Tax=Streptomyces sp. NPDC000410 TaxID=3154254 RepID=UPI00331AE488